MKNLTDNYFDPNYVSLQETRDKKLKDLGIKPMFIATVRDKKLTQLGIT